MKKLFIAMTVLLALCASCGDDEYFNQSDYEEIIDEGFPIDSFDKDQQWKTIKTSTMDVSVALGSSGSYTVRVTDSNPATAESATVYGEATVSDGSSVSFRVSYPLIASSLYVSLEGSGNTMTVTQAAALNDSTLSAAFTQSDVAWVEKSATLSNFVWRTCFEDAFPITGDYDFNDIVMTLSASPMQSNRKVVVLTATLNAVGSLSDLGCAARLVGIKPSDIDSVGVTQAFTQYPWSYSPVVADADKGYQTGKTGEVVIPFFNDGHYAISNGMLANDGSIALHYYNTVGNGTKSSLKELGYKNNGHTATYRIWCKTEETARKIAHDIIDVFEVTEFNGSYYEVHCMPYKRVEAICIWHNNSITNAYSDNYPWAISVPGLFKYPAEGVQISKYKNRVVSGAYATANHSFAEWAKDHTTAQDWYNYPNTSFIYE